MGNCEVKVIELPLEYCSAYFDQSGFWEYEGIPYFENYSHANI